MEIQFFVFSNLWNLCFFWKSAWTLEFNLMALWKVNSSPVCQCLTKPQTAMSFIFTLVVSPDVAWPQSHSSSPGSVVFKCPVTSPHPPLCADESVVLTRVHTHTHITGTVCRSVSVPVCAREIRGVIHCTFSGTSWIGHFPISYLIWTLSLQRTHTREKRKISD